jgi:endoglucanase Acf2
MFSLRLFRTFNLFRLPLALTLLIVIALIANNVNVQASPSRLIVAVGAGSYTTDLPAGATAPSPTVYKTANVTSKMPTNDWWTSLAWKPWGAASENMFPHPLMMKAVAKGLNIAYPKNLNITPDGRKYEYPFAGPTGSNEAMILGTVGLNSAATDVKVDGFSDWTVTADWSNGALKATFGHGLPFVYLTKGTSADAQITLIMPPTIISNANGAVHLTVNGQTYGIYGPAGSVWTLNALNLTSSLAGKNYFSVAVLPDATPATFNDVKAHAMAFVTNTTVSWSVNAAASTVSTTFTATTTVKEGTEARPIMALYRHQWLNSTAVNTAYTYVSPRGEMKVVRGSSFTTTTKYNGVLPWLPDVGTYNRTQLNNYINDILALGSTDARLHIPGPSGFERDTYWYGKGLGLLAMLVPIADQMGNTTARDTFLNDLKVTLQNWYTASAGETKNLFYYDNNWGTLIGYEANYGSQTELNDHHFHYGYYVLASAIVSMYDPTWASTANWGGMTELLIKDFANISTASDARFPRLRNFDPYAGHSWASGAQGFAAGNNQESSSEGTNSSLGILLWGASTGNTAMRDLGIYLYATEVAAIEQYWFDVDNVVFPNTNYSHNYVAMVWGDGGSYSTWWTANAEEIHGINLLPVTTGSLYLGKRPTYVNSFYNELVASNGGQEQEWADVIWMYQAFANPSAAITKFGTGNYTPEWGETKAHTYHWLHNLNALGNFDATVTGNIPTSAVFNKNGTRTYIAYNPSNTAVTVTFSNGVTLSVPARKEVSSGGVVGPTPTPVTPTPITPTFIPPTTTTPVTPTAVTPTPTTPTPTAVPGGNTFYVIDGASTTVNGTLNRTAGTGAATDTVPATGGGNYDGTPHSQITYVVSGVSGTYDATKATQFNLFLDSYGGVGNGTQARISYDLNGDNTYDRVETYNYFATDAINGFEKYDQTKNIKTATGAFSNLSNGKIKVEIWSAIGVGATDVRTSATTANGSQSLVNIPYNNVTVGGNPTATPTTPTATPTTATPTGTPKSNLVYVIDGATTTVASTLSFSAGTAANTDSSPSAAGGNYDGTPHTPLVYVVSGVTGTYDSTKTTQFSLYLDAGTGVGLGTQARISYDLNGDNVYDRVETYNYFPTDPVAGWEKYDQTRNLRSSSGTFGNMTNGKIKLEIWNAIGNGATNVRTSATAANGSQSTVTIPYINVQ